MKEKIRISSKNHLMPAYASNDRKSKSCLSVTAISPNSSTVVKIVYSDVEFSVPNEGIYLIGKVDEELKRLSLN